MKILLTLLLSCQLFATPLKVPTYYYSGLEPSKNHPGLAPFIGHLSFRNICDHIIDQSTEWFDPETVKQGDLIYLNLWYLKWFADTVHDRIKYPYILVSGDVGAWFPHPEMKKFLYDPKLAAWFCRNIVFSYHPKLFQIPMGQDITLFSRSPLEVNDLLKAVELKPSIAKEHLLYMNHCPREHGDRDKIAKLFQDKPYCHALQQNTLQTRETFYRQLCASKFTISPLGLETDCVRTWEAFLFDCIPIVEHTFCDPIFEGMPILIVHDWTEINQPLLEQKYEELKNLNREKAYFDYWEKLLKSTQTKVRNNDLAFTQLEATLFTPEELHTLNEILKDRGTSLIYKGFLSTLRPLQLSQYGHFLIQLYDAWIDQNIYRDLCTKSNLPNLISLIPTETAFSQAIATEEPINVFLDLTYYRTSLKLSFNTSVCHMGNFRHSLKLDLEDLYEDLQPDSLLFGTMADEPYVKKVLNLFAKENGIQIERHGPFWSLIKQPQITPLDELFPLPYDSLKEKIPFQLTKWYTAGHIFRQLIAEHDMKNIVHIHSALSATTLQLGELIPCDGKVFAVDLYPEETQYQQFLSNVIHSELTNHIIPVRMDPIRAAKKIKKLDIPIDLIYLDTPEDYFSTYQTLQAWFPYVKKSGLLCGNGWDTPEIQRAVIQFALENNQIIEHENNFWLFL